MTRIQYDYIPILPETKKKMKKRKGEDKTYSEFMEELMEFKF
jgi:hypothetical protein